VIVLVSSLNSCARWHLVLLKIRLPCNGD